VVQANPGQLTWTELKDGNARFDQDALGVRRWSPVLGSMGITTRLVMMVKGSSKGPESCGSL